MARFAFAAVLVGAFNAVNALEVVLPSEGIMIVADSTYTVEWTGTGEGFFDIDLYYCGSSCFEGDCGDWVTALCPYADRGCPDSDGDFDVVMPEPMFGTSGSGYKVRVADATDDSISDCSDEFYLMASEEAPEVGDDDGPTIVVTSPSDGDSAVPGEEYTVEFDYDNGLGSSVGRFDIDLYEAEGTGDCGTWFATLCDKPSIGCKDSMGDYDIVIPEDTPEGEYKIRVGLFGDDDLFDCSGTFDVEEDDDDLSFGM